MKFFFEREFLGSLILLFVSSQVYSQTVELQNSFDNIISILREYNIETPEVNGSRSPDPSLVVKKMTFSFKYPNAYISYYLAYAPNVTEVAGYKPGKRTITFSILDTDFKEGYASYNNKSLHFHSEIGIEKTELDKKDLLESWNLVMSPLICKKLCKELHQFKFLVNKTGFNGSMGNQQIVNSNYSVPHTSNNIVIKLQKEEGGVYTIPCKVNGLSLKFIFDTGASSVSISKSEAIFMLKNGYLSENEIIGSKQFQTASGAILEGTRILIKKIEIGGLVLRNVEANVVHSNNAPLLLGQNVLSRLGKISIDYQTSSLTISR